MRRPIKKKSNKLAADGVRIANLAQAVAQSGSRLEDLFWQQQLDLLVAKAMKTHHQDVLDAAADHLFQAHPNSYEVMMETVETVSTSYRLEYEGQVYDALLLTAPVLAWTRFEIASGKIGAETLAALQTQLGAHILADEARMQMLPTLYSIDQLPRTHSDVFGLTEQLAQALAKGQLAKPAVLSAPTVPFLADTRYLLTIVLAPSGKPMFRWQLSETPFDTTTAKNAALEQWQLQASPTVGKLLPGCGVELLLPEAYYTACREADIRIRPVSVRAAVFFLCNALGVEPEQLAAVIAGFGDPDNQGQIDEYRIGFAKKDAPEIVYGVVWPIYQQDDQLAAVELPPDQLAELAQAGADNLPGEIPTVLAECGVLEVTRLEDIFSMEFCDDCGAPLFADRDGELVHAEMPDDAPPQGSAHFH
jgi:hypothetical protein